MLSNLSNERLANVHPELARRVRNLADALDADGIVIQISVGTRTAAEQDELYSRGRTAPGEKVTNARGYQSNHVIGCAVDVWEEDETGQKPNWDANSPSWQRLVALAPSFGLRDGKSWHDLPHLELADIPTEPSGIAQQICKVDGLQAVWQHLNVPTFGSGVLPGGAVSA